MLNHVKNFNSYLPYFASVEFQPIRTDEGLHITFKKGVLGLTVCELYNDADLDEHLNTNLIIYQNGNSIKVFDFDALYKETSFPAYFLI